MSEAFQLIHLQARPGTVKGLRSPSLALRLRLLDVQAVRRVLEHFASAIARDLPPPPPDVPGPIELLRDGDRIDPAESAVLAIGTTMQWIVGAAGVPITEPPRVFPLSPKPLDSVVTALRPADWAIYVPTHSLRGARQAFDWLSNALMRSALRKPGYTNGTGGAGAATEGLAELLAEISALVPTGVNSRQFLAAAQQLDIPAIPRAGGIWQYGVGRHGRLMLSTLTDKTPSIGVKLARSKSIAVAFLREAGLPVPDQTRVATEASAVEAARRMGYPLVIKPAALDGGRGVAAGLMTAEAVRLAWRRAAVLSDDILLERHVPGRDYRLTVFGGKMLFAVERVPGGVTGDGQRTVQQLVALENRDPARQPQGGFQMVPVVLDAEVQELLTEQGLSLDSVPQAERRIRLRRTASTSRGGAVHYVTDVVHMENIRLAVRAAAALRLDLAGIDMLMPDISRPWHEQGGAIREVNAEEQIGLSAPQQFGQILTSLLAGCGKGGTGRVPIGVFMTGPDEASLVPRLARTLSEAGVTPGAATPSRMVVGGSVIARPPPDSVFEQTRALQCDPTVECLLIEVVGTDLLRTGLPFDRFDLLHIGRGLTAPGPAGPAQMKQVLSLLVDHCQGEIRLTGAACEDRDVQEILGSRLAMPCPVPAAVVAWHKDHLQQLLTSAGVEA